MCECTTPSIKMTTGFLLPQMGNRGSYLLTPCGGLCFRIQQIDQISRSGDGKQKPRRGPDVPLPTSCSSLTCVREMETETQRFSCLAPEAYLPSLALNHCRTRVTCGVAETEPKLGVVQSSIIDYSLIALFLASGRMKLPDLVFERQRWGGVWHSWLPLSP